MPSPAPSARKRDTGSSECFGFPRRASTVSGEPSNIEPGSSGGSGGVSVRTGSWRSDLGGGRFRLVQGCAIAVNFQIVMALPSLSTEAIKTETATTSTGDCLGQRLSIYYKVTSVGPMSENMSCEVERKQSRVMVQ